MLTFHKTKICPSPHFVAMLVVRVVRETTHIAYTGRQRVNDFINSLSLRCRPPTLFSCEAVLPSSVLFGDGLRIVPYQLLLAGIGKCMGFLVAHDR